MDQPQAADFVSISKDPSGKFSVGITVSKITLSVSGYTLTEEEAEAVKFAISQAMVDFHDRRNEWADELRSELQGDARP